MRSFIPKHLQDLLIQTSADDRKTSREFSVDPESNLEVRPIADRERERYAQGMQERENIFHWNALSPREREVVALVCMGQRNYQIAETLGIAHGTVKSHLEKIFRKFNVNDRHAIRLALVEWDFRGWWPDRHLLPAPLPARTIYR